MDNVKKFEDFLDRMQGLLDNAKKQGHIIVRIEDLENAFPELKESEDERIRKNIIATIHLYYGEPLDGEAKEMIAWLEKQGEKPAEEYNITGIGSKNAQGKLGKMIKKLKHDNEVLEQKHSIDINKMVDDYANSSERGNEEFGKPVPCMIRAYRQGLNDAIGKVVRNPAWSEEDEAHINGIIDYLLDYKLLVYEEDMNVANGVQKELDWLKSIKQRIGE